MQRLREIVEFVALHVCRFSRNRLNLNAISSRFVSPYNHHRIKSLFLKILLPLLRIILFYFFSLEQLPREQSFILKLLVGFSPFLLKNRLILLIFYILLFFSIFSSCKIIRERGERGNDKREKEREREVKDWIRWGVNFILANQGTGWSRSTVSSAVDDEKKVTKSTTIRFLDCQSSVPLTRSVKLIF